MAKAQDSLRTNHLDHFEQKTAFAETTDFFKNNVAKLQDSLRINDLNDIRHRSTVPEMTDFFKGQCSKGR